MKIAAEFLALDLHKLAWNIRHDDQCTTLRALSERFS